MDNVVDMATRKTIERLDIDESSSVAQYLNFWKKQSATRNVQSVMIMTVNDQGEVAWDVKGYSEDHLLRFQSCLKHMDNFLDSMIWPEDEDEIDVELE